MKNPKVSVIIPVYNVEKYLAKCLDSVISQTYSNLEIICINDGSSDNSLEILNSYSQKDCRVIVISQDNQGVSVARNKGLEIATGEYIAFVDSDDWLEPECIQLPVEKMLNDSEINLVCWGANAIGRAKGWFNARYLGKFKPQKNIIMNITGVLWQCLFKREIIERGKIRFSNYKLAEDILFLIKYFAYVDYIYFIKLNLYNYIERQDSAVQKYGGKNNPLYALETNINVTIELLEYYKERNKLELFNKIYFHRQMASIYWALKHSKDCEKQKCISLLKFLVSYLDGSIDWGTDVKYIRQNKFYKISALNYPYFTFGNNIFGVRLYRGAKSSIKVVILGLKFSLNYQKIFYVKNEDKHKVINILGLKFKIVRNGKFGDYIKKFLSLFLGVYIKHQNNKTHIVINMLGIKFQFLIPYEKKLEYFIKRHNSYTSSLNKVHKRRLFLTTGNISLINSLTVIKQLSEKNCEDILFIYSNMKNESFDECNRKVAGLHEFKRIYTLYEKTDDFRNYFIDMNLSDFDEVYFVNIYQYISLVKELYPKSKWILIDEGAGCALARNEYLNFDKVDKIMMHNYLNKIDFLGIEEHHYSKIEFLKKEIFLDIAYRCASMYPIDLNLKDGEKAVLFCGSWWEVSGLSKEQYFEIQNSIMKKLLSLGYKVFFKPHPRDPRNYIEIADIEVLSTSLPLECYTFDEVVAVVSLYSTASMQMFYFNNIPGFSLPFVHRINKSSMSTKWLDLLVKKLFEEYTTPIEELFSVNPMLYSKEELKRILINKCLNYLKKKPILSQNEEFKKFAIEKGYRIPRENYEEILSGGKDDK